MTREEIIQLLKDNLSISLDIEPARYETPRYLTVKIQVRNEIDMGYGDERFTTIAESSVSLD